MTFRATHTFTPSSHALRTPLLLAKRNERDILYEAPTQVRGSHGSALPPPSLRLLPAVASTLVSLVLAPFALHSPTSRAAPAGWRRASYRDCSNIPAAAAAAAAALWAAARESSSQRTRAGQVNPL